MTNSGMPALLMIMILFLSQTCFATASNNDVAAKEANHIFSETNALGSRTNVTESLARDIYIIHEKETTNEAQERNQTILGRLGLSDTLQGVLIAGLMSGMGMLFRLVFEMRKRNRQYKEMREQERRVQLRRLNNDRRKAYLDFMAFYLLVNNCFRGQNNTAMPRELRQEYVNLLPTESVAKAADINARIRLFASKEVAEAHLRFMEAVRVIYTASDKDAEKRADDVRKILIIISDAMNKELCQVE